MNQRSEVTYTLEIKNAKGDTIEIEHTDTLAELADFDFDYADGDQAKITKTVTVTDSNGDIITETTTAIR
jgi:hypothetical protein